MIPLMFGDLLEPIDCTTCASHRMQSFAPEELESFEVPSPLNPETVEKLIHASSRPVVPPESCAWVTVEARKHFEEKGFVENGPEDFAPSSHVHVSSIPAILQWFNEFFKATGMPLLKTAFSLTLEQCTSLRIHEAVVIRCEGRASS